MNEILYLCEVKQHEKKEHTRKYLTWQEAINGVISDTINLRSLPPELATDRNFVLTFFEKIYDKNIFFQISNTLHEDRDIIELALAHNLISFSELITKNPHLIQDNSILFAALGSTTNNNYDLIPNEKWQDKRFVLQALEHVHNLYIFHVRTKRMWSHDPDVMLKSVSIRAASYAHILEPAANSVEIARVAFKISYSLFEYAGKDIRNHPELAYEAIMDDEKNLMHVGNKLRQNFDFIWSVLQQKPDAYRHLSGKIASQPNIIEHVINHNPSLYHYIPKKIKKILGEPACSSDKELQEACFQVKKWILQNRLQDSLHIQTKPVRRAKI